MATNREIFKNKNLEIRRNVLRRRELPRRDSEENLSFWTSSTKRKFNEQIHFKNTGKLPEPDFQQNSTNLSSCEEPNTHRVHSLRISPEDRLGSFVVGGNQKTNNNSATAAYVKKVVPGGLGLRMSMEQQKMMMAQTQANKHFPLEENPAGGGEI